MYNQAAIRFVKVHYDVRNDYRMQEHFDQRQNFKIGLASWIYNRMTFEMPSIPAGIERSVPMDIYIDTPSIPILMAIPMQHHIEDTPILGMITM